MAYIGNAPATGENNSFKILDDITSYTLTFNGSYASVVSLADDTITKNEHRFITGQRVTYTHGGGTAIGGLTSGSVYYIVKNDQNTIKLAPSYADAIGSTNLINFTSLGTGSSHTLNVAFDGVNTKFKATYDNGTKAGITRAAQLQISINGVIQRPYDSVTPPSGFGFDLDSVIVFSTAPASTDVFWGNLVANNFPTFDIADNEIDNFIGDATTVSYTLSKTPANSQNILVTLDGVVQYPSDNDTTRAYTLSENVLTFDSAPGAGVFIQVRHIGFAGATSSSVTGFYGRTGNVALRHIDNVKVGNVESVGVSTFTTTGVGTVTIGIGTTALLVEGNARVTGILTVGNSSITIDGDTNKISIGDETTFIQNGAIGIGTTNLEGNALKVTGTTDITGNTTIGGNTTVDGNISLKSLDYAGISSTISDTAVDVFVYDTSKDSDGGAWRYKTQRTSWYNETLNTATRGSRREFPAVAVIVAETGSITIYDGDDPDLPMWMVFNGTVNPVNASGTMLMGNNHQLAVEMLNGVLVNASNGQGTGKIQFVSDDGYLYWSSTSTGGKFKGNISQRNSGQGYDTSQAVAIVHPTTNDVAMTVLPNAPIDDATGLPIPTIAVATDGGVSVIKDDGTVVDLTYSATNAISRFIHISEEGKIRYGLRSYSSIDNFYIAVYNNIPSSDTSSAPDSLYTYGNSGGGGNGYYYLTTQRNGTTTAIRDCIDLGNQEFAASTVDYSGAGAYGIHKVVELPSFNSSSVPEPLVAIATTSFNTGWMHGDIKGAFLSDTDATNVTGTELVSNGDFSSALDTNVWENYAPSVYLTTYSIVSGELQVIENNANNYGIIVQEITVEVGKTYTIKADIRATTGEARFWAGVGGGSATYGYKTSTSSTASTVSFTFVPTQTSCYVSLASFGSGATAYFDNISLRLADPDRSVNNNGLQVFGTITKSAVATGAELVAYEFDGSNSNYLEQPYNSDLDFGTGDFSIMYWFYQSTTDNTYQDVLSRASAIDGSWTFQHQNTGVIWFYVRTGGGYQTVLTSDNSITTSSWTHVAVVRSGGKMNMYINGAIGDANGGNSSYEGASMTASGARLRINTRVDQSAWTIRDGNSIALVRLSASAPSPEQIKKIYEDEKVLFQENAACTLYGSSDAVTALAYDEVNDLLHVGTSSGRSDFNGLRRINNTTTAVSTAISAYDGLIAAQ